MKGGSAPTPPDPTTTAAAQTQSNRDTAGYQQDLNMVNQVTPYGSLTYNQTGTGPSGAPTYTATTALSDSGQKNFDLQQQVSEALNKLALSSTGQVQSAMGKAQTYDNLPETQALDLTKLPSVKSFDPSTLAAAPASIDVSKLKDLPTGLDTSKLAAMPQADAAARQRAEDALYAKNTSRLDPQFQQDQRRLETQLINKGIAQGSEAWNDALDQFGRTRTDAYSNARNDSIAGGANYALTDFGMQDTAYKNSLNQANSELAAALAANQQGFGQAQAQFTAGQTARNQSIAEQLSAAQVSGNQRAQALGEQQASNATSLANRQQGITEQNYLRELPINEISALLNGGQVQMPTFNNTPQSSVANTNVAGIIQNDYNNQFNKWQQDQATNNAIIGGLFKMGGAALGGWATGGFA